MRTYTIIYDGSGGWCEPEGLIAVLEGPDEIDWQKLVDQFMAEQYPEEMEKILKDREYYYQHRIEYGMSGRWEHCTQEEQYLEVLAFANRSIQVEINNHKEELIQWLVETQGWVRVEYESLGIDQ